MKFNKIYFNVYESYKAHNFLLCCHGTAVGFGMTPPVPLSLSVLLTKKVLKKADVGKRKALRTHSLARTLSTPLFTRTVKGTDAEKSGTKADYENKWSHFHDFCVLLGFYTCALVLDRENCPDRPIPVEIDSVRMYIQYKSNPTGDELVHPDTKVPVRDVMGKVVHCTGTWQSPTNLFKFRAAMLGLDSLHAELMGPYMEQCDECTALTKQTGTGSRTNSRTLRPCLSHTEGARLRSRGGVMNAPAVKRYVSYTMNLLKGYKKKGNIQLLPSEVRLIRAALMAENSLHGLQYWTMVIMGIKLFLRVTELLTMKVEDFPSEFMMLESSTCHVSALAVRILGKGGDYHWLSMFSDDEFPQLCPIRALLLYLSLSRIKKGYLFPECLPRGDSTEATHDDSSTESTGEGHYPYLRFITKMKVLLNVTLGRDMGPQDIFGTHILRKTAYLFAIFGMLRQYGQEVGTLHDLLMQGIMDSARHACILNVRWYSRDASTRYEWDKAKRVRTENELPYWRSIHILDTNVIRAATETSRAQQQHLCKIALGYLTNFLGFTVQVPVLVAVEKAFSSITPTIAVESSADLHVKALLSAGDYQDYLDKKKLDTGNLAVVVRVVPSVPPTTANLSYSNPERPTLAGKSTLERIKIFGSMYESDKGLRPCTFKAAYKSFFYSKVKPVGLCLAHCFGGDIALFDQKLDSLPNRGTYSCCSDSHLCKSVSI
jgi:hypothetical protein